MDVVIIILCWRFNKHIPALLKSISKQKSRYQCAAVLCYNSAAEDAPHAFTQSMDGSIPFHQIFTGGNLGYGGGNNFAISWAKKQFSPRYFFHLNSDVLLTEGALEAIVRWADDNPGAAIIGAVQTNPQSECSQHYCGGRYNPMLSLISRVPAKKGARIDYVNGGSVLLRSAAFSDDPVFPEHYFLFFEELEMTLRVKSMGHSTGYCPDCIVLHREGTTRNGVDADDYCPEVSEYFENLNALRFTRDHYPYYLPIVLFSRSFGKFIWLLLRGKWKRMVFWYLALGDFLLGRIRRFPFQQGWCPEGGKDRIFDAKMPL